MKTWIILAGTIALSGTAVAQNAPATTDTPAQTAPEPTAPAQDAPMPAPAPDAASPMAQPMPPAAEQPTTTVTTTTDSMGTPTGTTVNVASPGNYTAPPAPDSPASYPFCSRAVTDHCKQRRDPK